MDEFFWEIKESFSNSNVNAPSRLSYFYAWGLPKLREPAYNKELIHLILGTSWEEKGKREDDSHCRRLGETEVFDLISPTTHYFWSGKQ